MRTNFTAAASLCSSGCKTRIRLEEHRDGSGGSKAEREAEAVALEARDENEWVSTREEDRIRWVAGAAAAAATEARMASGGGGGGGAVVVVAGRRSRRRWDGAGRQQ